MQVESGVNMDHEVTTHVTWQQLLCQHLQVRRKLIRIF